MSDYTFCGRPVRIWNNSVYDEYDHYVMDYIQQLILLFSRLSPNLIIHYYLIN